jgi:hypothetical protein
MDVDLRKERRARIREVISDAKLLVEKEFPYVAEETNEYRITVLSIANMIIEDGKTVWA